MFFNNCGQPGDIGLESTINNKPNQITDNPVSGDQPSQIEEPGLPIVDPIKDPEEDIPDTIGVEPPKDPNKTPDDTVPSLPKPIWVKSNSQFLIGEKPKVDILFIVDNSKSMVYEQQSMAKRFSLFIDQIKNLDWQIGITTTDVLDPKSVTSDGKLLKYEGINKYIITSKMDLSVVKNEFAATIQRSEVGNYKEQGVRALYRFLEHELDKNKLIRTNSHFVAIIVSDADESPFEDEDGNVKFTKRNSPEKLVKFFKTIWPGKNLQVNSIIVPSGDDDCLNSNNNESYGLIYEKLAGITSGLIGSVCAEDYSAQLEIIGKSVKNLTNKLTLSCVPGDVDNNGQIDVQVKDTLGNLIPYQRITGDQVIFAKNLPTGLINIEYFCKK